MKRSARTWRKLTALAAAAVLFTIPSVPFMLGVASFVGLTHPACNDASLPAMDAAAVEEITLTSAGRTLRGYWLPGTANGVIIHVPAFNSGRGASWEVSQSLASSGFHVLVFESRACAGFGSVSLGYHEVEDVLSAINYVQNRPDAQGASIGLWGFSSAGATSIMATPQSEAIRAVAAAGGYHHFAELLGAPGLNDAMVGLYRIGARLAYRASTDIDVERLTPIDSIPGFGERPLFLVYGSLESSLPGARQMLTAAHESGVPAELWVVPGADHGNYLDVAGDEFTDRLSAFFRAHLTTPPAN